MAGLALLLAACAAGEPFPPPTPGPPSPTPAVSVPADGVTLAALGFAYGPRDAFSVPRTAVITTRVDQPNTVTLVFAAPPARDLGGYLRRALPAAGFAVTAADGQATTLTFTGQGWSGSFTGTGATSAVNLRPV